MMISTRGRYALRVMLDLAEYGEGEYIPLKEVAERQEISLKYMEAIMGILTRNGLVEGQHGRGGGYRLSRGPDAYTVGDVLRLTETSLAPVACLAEGAAPCRRAPHCRTLPMWTKLERMITDYFDSISLADLMEPAGRDINARL